MTNTGQTKVVAQGGGGWINQDPIREVRRDNFTHYHNSRGVVTIGEWDTEYTVISCKLNVEEGYSTREDAEDRVYEILENKKNHEI